MALKDLVYIIALTVTITSAITSFIFYFLTLALKEKFITTEKFNEFKELIEDIKENNKQEMKDFKTNFVEVISNKLKHEYYTKDDASDIFVTNKMCEKIHEISSIGCDKEIRHGLEVYIKQLQDNFKNEITPTLSNLNSNLQSIIVKLNK